MSRRCNGGPSFFGILLLSTCLLLAWLPRSSWSSSSNYVNAESVGRPGAGGAGTTTTEAVDLLSQYEQLSNSSLRWMQRPNLYYGMRARVQGDSPLFGLMWFGIHDYGGFNKIRHSCEQGDNLAGYNWIEHDGRSAGVQIIKDVENNVQLKVEMLKTPVGLEGGSWAARISGEPIDPNRLSRISLITYYGLEGLGNLEMDSQDDNPEGLEGPFFISGSVSSLGAFSFRQVEVSNNGPVARGRHADDFGGLLDRTAYTGINVPLGQAWRAKEIIMNDIASNAQEQIKKYTQENIPDPALFYGLSNQLRYGSTFYAFQKAYQGPFKLDVFYESKASPKASGLDSDALSAGLQASSAAYADRFDYIFKLQNKGYSASEIDFAKSLTSSMMGGIGYFYGTSIVDRHFRHEYDEGDDDDDEDDYAGGKRVPKPELVPERELFTATPCRSFFPRGFYWDEGFHLLLVGAWDNDISLDILKSWINLIDDDGWVGREQILGEEARSKVPEEFRTQYPAYANPPTLPMAVTAYIKRLKKQSPATQTPDDLFPEGDVLGSPSDLLASLSASSSPAALSSVALGSTHLARTFLTSIYPKLRLHYNWFRATQRGQIREWGREVTGSRTEAYRWRGRSEDHVLTSGLDDYPRAKPPHEGELHVDLMSWMAFFTRTMREIAEYIGEEEDVQEYSKNEKAILTNLDELHWSEEHQMYCDASVDEYDESTHVCHQGYISIFPFLLGLLKPDSPHLGPILKALRDPDQLWSDYGIRSLSKSHPLYGEGENYWRGPVWISLNYMALQSLYNIYAKESGPYQQQAAEIYDELRSNIVSNTHKEYLRTGYAWEQYDPNNGEGRRSHPFTGWTSLVTLIMAEQY